MHHLAVCLTLLSLVGSSGATGPADPPPNIVLILADDMGVDLVGAYQALEGSMDVPCTPNLDDLAAQGMLFRNAWTNPTCSPSRAQTLTGRYGFRTGVGDAITSGAGELPASEDTIAELLSGYASAALGKWHLGTAVGSNPWEQGFPTYKGFLTGTLGVGNTLPCYFGWEKTVYPPGGPGVQTTTYATTDTASDAILAATWMPEPWFLYVNFNAPHSPFHEPPPNLCPQDPACGGDHCDSMCYVDPPDCLDPGCGQDILVQRRQVRAMVEALDTAIGRMLTAIRAVDPDAIVLFMGDNGTLKGLSVAPFDGHGKGEVYEGGVNVPLIVQGPMIPQQHRGAVCNGLVASADLAATILELSGGTAATIPVPNDSVSMMPYFSNPAIASLRETVYTERFQNGTTWPSLGMHRRAVRNDRYKLIRLWNGPDEFYDLMVDPFEHNDIFQSLHDPGFEEELDNYAELVTALAALGVD